MDLMIGIPWRWAWKGIEKQSSVRKGADDVGYATSCVYYLSMYRFGIFHITM